MNDLDRIEPSFNEDRPITFDANDPVFAGSDQNPERLTESRGIYESNLERPLSIWIPTAALLLTITLHALAETIGFNFDALGRLFGAILDDPYVFFMAFVLSPVVIVILIPTLLILILSIFKPCRTKNVRRWIFLVWSLLYGATLVFNIIAVNPGKYESAFSTPPQAPTDGIEANQEESTNNGDSLSARDLGTASNRQLVIPAIVEDLESKAKALPRVPWLPNVAAYQYLHNLLKKDYETQVGKLSNKDLSSTEFAFYKETVDQKLGLYSAKVDFYTELITNLSPALQQYYLTKIIEDKLIETCLGQGVSLVRIYAYADEVDAPAEEAFKKGLYLIGIPEQDMQATLLKNEDINTFTDFSVSAIFDTLKKLGGPDTTRMELCELYYANNTNQPERKAFINRFPEIYKIMAEAK